MSAHVTRPLRCLLALCCYLLLVQSCIVLHEKKNAKKDLNFFLLSCIVLHKKTKFTRSRRGVVIKGCICFSFLARRCNRKKDLREGGEGYQKHAEARHCHVSPKGVFSSPEFCAHTRTRTHTHSHARTHARTHTHTHITYIHTHSLHQPPTHTPSTHPPTHPPPRKYPTERRAMTP
jgi:hypothetical protein